MYGMSGDLGDLRAITELKKKYNFRLLVDDAHGFGTMGPTGAGTGEHLGVQDEIDVYFATFAKAMAGIGAFVLLQMKKWFAIYNTICVHKFLQNHFLCHWLLAR